MLLFFVNALSWENLTCLEILTSESHYTLLFVHCICPCVAQRPDGRGGGMWVGFRSPIWTTTSSKGQHSEALQRQVKFQYSHRAVHEVIDHRNTRAKEGLCGSHDTTMGCYHIADTNPLAKNTTFTIRKQTFLKQHILRKYGYCPGSYFQKPLPAECPCPSWKVGLLFGSAYKNPMGLFCSVW